MAQVKNLIVNGKSIFSKNANINGRLLAKAVKTHIGTSTQFLKADGTIDNNKYALNASIGDTSSYLDPLTNSELDDIYGR